MSAHATERVPKTLRPRYEAIVRLTDEFCASRLDDDYAALCRRMAAALARKRPSPLARGKIESWACGIVHAAGSTNFLFDSSFEPYVSAGEIADWFGVAASTGAAKARAVKDALRIRGHDWEWMLPEWIERNPLVWMIEIDGVIADARQLPLAIQEEAARRGLIPYVPEARAPEASGAGEHEAAAGGQAMMSEVLVDVAEPLLESMPEGSSSEVYRAALSVAAEVWNASRDAVEPERLEEVRAFMVSEWGAPPALAEEIVSTLHRRAVEGYPAEARVIIDVDAFFQGEELRVRVMSRLPEEGE